MNFDLRPFELMSSVIITATFAGVSLFLSGLVTLFALLMIKESLLVSGLMCLFALPMPLVGLALQWVVLWSRRGGAHRYLTEVAEALGVEAEISTGNLLLPLLSPRLDGTLEGRKLQLTLRRTAGVFTASDPSGGGLVPWQLRGTLGGSVPHKVGFSREGAPPIGYSLLGLSNPAQRPGLTLFTGPSEALADDPEVLSAGAALHLGPTTLVTVDGQGLHITDRLKGTRASDLADQLHKLTALATALERSMG